MVDPLQKRKKSGVLYTRFADIEQQLNQLTTLPVAQIVARCALGKGLPGYIPSECLMHLFRRGIRQQQGDGQETLFKTLLARVRLAFRPDGDADSMKNVHIFEGAYDELVSRLSEEATGYNERLDFFEVNFTGALASLFLDQRKAARRFHRKHGGLLDEETGEVIAEVEAAAGSFDPFDPIALQKNVYRLALAKAVEQLPPDQMRVIELLRQGIPIESKDPDVTSICTALGVVEKTVRNRRDRAFATLKEAIEKGDL